MLSKCVGCNVALPASSFSKNQIKKRGNRRCVSCIKNLHGGGSANPGPSVRLASADKDELIKLAKLLTHENVALKVEILKLRERENSLELQASENLRAEARRWQTENKELRNTVARQTSQLAEQSAVLTKLSTQLMDQLSAQLTKQSAQLRILMKSHDMKSRLAIRRLLHDAEEYKDKSAFSEDAQDFLLRYAGESPHRDNRAAQVDVSQERIREAVIQYKKPKATAILIDLFTKCYGRSIEEEEDEIYELIDFDC